MSSAYYAVFHALLAAAADEFVGKTKQNTTEYILHYRSINHAWLRQLCDGVKGAQPSRRFVPYTPSGGFGPNVQALAEAVIDLQEKRHTADYDPSVRVKSADALLAIRTGRTALLRFHSEKASRRRRFLALLAFPPR